jgi:hypothetical protein
MPTRFDRIVVLGLLMAGVIGCAANPNVRARRLPDKRIQVDGPLAGPFKTTAALATRACEIMTSQGGASAGNEGSEYCAVHYYSSAEDSYYLSYLSDIKSKLDTRQQKTCEMPRVLNDVLRPDAIVTGGDHTHAHNRQFSPGDLRGHWNPPRVADKQTGRIFQRELLLFYRERSGECRAYSYNYATLVVSALREEAWVPIGQVYGDSGSIQMFEGKGWLP